MPGTNTFQCVLAYNANDSFILFLYADHLIQWSSHGAQVGIDGGDGINYFSIPTSRTADIVNITSTSNVNQPGLWIFKVDTYIIGGMVKIRTLNIYFKSLLCRSSKSSR